jgi:demethylmenaquinone methyltransferase/2-methoxy-6-polyprenyl-1,4-benzoquinol methylase
MSTVASTPRKEHALELFAGLPAHYDRIAALFSFGQDPRWRRRMVSELRAAPGDRVLDVACGTGLVTQAIVRRYGCEVVGLDQSEPMLDGARRRAAADPALRGKVSLVQAQAEQLPFEDASFDGLTYTYLLRYVDDPAATLRELARVVRPGGRIASLEFFVPPAPVWRAAWRLYCAVGLPVLGRLVSRDWYRVGRFLGPSISGFYARYPLARVVAMWREAGIEDVRAQPMSLGGGVVIWGVKSGGGPAA